jgi:hypothetical protein
MSLSEKSVKRGHTNKIFMLKWKSISFLIWALACYCLVSLKPHTDMKYSASNMHVPSA